jgi:hypothetical protein
MNRAKWRVLSRIYPVPFYRTTIYRRLNPINKGSHRKRQNQKKTCPISATIDVLLITADIDTLWVISRPTKEPNQFAGS